MDLRHLWDCEHSREFLRTRVLGVWTGDRRDEIAVIEFMSGMSRLTAPLVQDQSDCLRAVRSLLARLAPLPKWAETEQVDPSTEVAEEALAAFFQDSCAQISEPKRFA